MSGLLNENELAVLRRLGAAWNEFVLLSPVHDDEQVEFRRAIHAAQHIIMSRPVAREAKE